MVGRAELAAGVVAHRTGARTRPMMGRAEPNFSLSGLKTAVRMEDSEIDALIAIVKDLIGDVGGFLGEEESRTEREGKA